MSWPTHSEGRFEEKLRKLKLWDLSLVQASSENPEVALAIHIFT